MAWSRSVRAASRSCTALRWPVRAVSMRYRAPRTPGKSPRYLRAKSCNVADRLIELPWCRPVERRGRTLLSDGDLLLASAYRLRSTQPVAKTVAHEIAAQHQDEQPESRHPEGPRRA